MVHLSVTLDAPKYRPSVGIAGKYIARLEHLTAACDASLSKSGRGSLPCNPHVPQQHHRVDHPIPGAQAEEIGRRQAVREDVAQIDAA
jgi:hypothetical protein